MFKNISCSCEWANSVDRFLNLVIQCIDFIFSNINSKLFEVVWTVMNIMLITYLQLMSY